MASNQDRRTTRRFAVAAEVTLAWLALLWLDVLMRTRGFPALHRLVKRWPVRSVGTDTLGTGSSLETARALSARVDRAAAYYLKRAWCLQRSAATVLFLRWRGFPVQLCIGARKVPFLAHAWVELNGRVINDNEELIRARYATLERC